MLYSIRTMRKLYTAWAWAIVSVTPFPPGNARSLIKSGSKQYSRSLCSYKLYSKPTQHGN